MDDLHFCVIRLHNAPCGPHPNHENAKKDKKEALRDWLAWRSLPREVEKGQTYKTSMPEILIESEEAYEDFQKLKFSLIQL
jgi:hypothetical protein